MIFKLLLCIGFALNAVTSATAWAKPLTDGVSGSANFDAAPGLILLSGQQNLAPRFGLVAGYQRESFLQGSVEPLGERSAENTYSGWMFGTNALVAKILGENWRASSVASFGLGGMKGPVHDHSTAWAKLGADIETRHVLFDAFVEAQRGTAGMPAINALEVRTGYSPTEPDLNSVQPWFLIAWRSRTGTGDSRVFAMLRLLSGKWWLELGASLTNSDKLLSFSVAL